MSNYSLQQLGDMLTELTKRTSHLETSEAHRSYRESLFYPAYRSLCKRLQADNCWDRAVVGHHNKMIVPPVYMEDEEMGGAWNTAKNYLSQDELDELIFVRTKMLEIIARAADRRARRAEKNKKQAGKKIDPKQFGTGGPTL